MEEQVLDRQSRRSRVEVVGAGVKQLEVAGHLEVRTPRQENGLVGGERCSLVQEVTREIEARCIRVRVACSWARAQVLS